jgi:hypothetical protein
MVDSMNCLEWLTKRSFYPSRKAASEMEFPLREFISAVANDSLSNFEIASISKINLTSFADSQVRPGSILLFRERSTVSFLGTLRGKSITR